MAAADATWDPPASGDERRALAADRARRRRGLRLDLRRPQPDPQAPARPDRRAFGLEWEAELPDGGDAVGWDVEVNIDLLLLKAADVPA
jgi:hypothetical protein